MDSQRQSFLEREKRLDADYNLKLKEALVNLRETEGDPWKIHLLSFCLVQRRVTGKPGLPNEISC